MLPEWAPIHRTAFALAFLIAFGVVYAMDRPRGAWGRTLRSRLLLGVPWGTLVSVGFVICVYLFVQSGLENPGRPVVIPFRAWSYFYPEGMLWAGFSHASQGHVTGNLLSTLVAGTLAEYAYGHFPKERGSSSFGSWRSNPYARAFLFVPGAILLAGLFTALFALGPIIGFSGVVFALWGFALVHYPLGTIVALLGSTLVRVLYDAFRSPVQFAEATPSYGPPSWAGIAVQGHALGFFIGVIAAVYLIRRRRARSSAAGPTDGATTGLLAGRSGLAVFGGVLLFAASRQLWAVYWYLGNERYVLYRGIGLAMVVLLALLVAVAVAGRDEPLVPSWATPDPGSVVGAVRSASPAAVGLVLLVIVAGVVAGPAVIPNLVTVGDEELPGEPVEIEGYEVTYGENVPDQMVNVVEVEAFGQTTQVNTSGVIVRNTDRGIWTTAVSRGNLQFWGHRSVDVGGTGWRETVRVQRTGWVAVDDGPTYRVDLHYDDEWRTAFLSDERTAEPTIDGRNVTVAAVEDGFDVTVTHDNDSSTAPLPAENERVTLQGVTLVREDRHVYAERGDTRVRVLTQERYEGRERS